MEKITDKIAALSQNDTYCSLEFFPPKTPMGAANLQARLERMAGALHPLFVNVTWGAGGSTSSKSLELAEICQRQLGLTTCLHLTCTNMSRKLVDEALEEAKAMGIRNILALRGDPPRNEEYRREDDDVADWEFEWAIDLVKYIRKQHGDFFCIGVAAYPEGHWDSAHPDNQSREFDLPYLVEKTQAGADFIMTQLCYDVEAYAKFLRLLRQHESGAFKSIPIIPGLMPIQSYQILRRTTKLSHATFPESMLSRLDTVKGDDEAVKRVGVDILCEIIDALRHMDGTDSPKGFHFYTLNLEKVVTQVVEKSQLASSGKANKRVDKGSAENSIESEPYLGQSLELAADTVKESQPVNASSVENNTIDGDSSGDQGLRSSSNELTKNSVKLNLQTNTSNSSEGQGDPGREATWDDYPNGRWGDARSPAYGEIDGYGVSLHISIPQAVKLWSYPTSRDDISTIFRRYITGELTAMPWSEEGLNAETGTIAKQLLKLNSKGWWSMASQPGVNGIKSNDSTFGWGPHNGFVFQKPFVEIFVPSSDWKDLQAKLDKLDNATYFAGNLEGSFAASNEKAVNPVTWGVFPGKEIITPTIIEAVSFKAWLEEAFGIWTEWRRIYPSKSATSKLLGEVANDVWLVNIIWHDYVQKDGIWEALLDESM